MYMIISQREIPKRMHKIKCLYIFEPVDTFYQTALQRLHQFTVTSISSQSPISSSPSLATQETSYYFPAFTAANLIGGGKNSILFNSKMYDFYPHVDGALAFAPMFCSSPGLPGGVLSICSVLSFLHVFFSPRQVHESCMSFSGIFFSQVKQQFPRRQELESHLFSRQRAILMSW